MIRRLSRRTLAKYATEQILAGADKSELVSQIAGYLVENRRTKEADLIVHDIELALATNGVIVAHVSSARKLSDSSIESIRSALSTSGKVQMRTSLDPELLGGVIIQTPGHELDGSLRRRLNLLKSRNNYI